MRRAEIAREPASGPFRLTACGPTGKLSKEAVRDLVVIYAATITVRILVKAWSRAQGGMEPPTSALLLGAAAILAAVAAFLFWRMIRRQDYWTLFLAGALGFVSFFRFDAEPLALGTVLETPLVLLPLLPAAVTVWAFLRMVRQTDELERRINYQALALAFGVTFAASLLWSVLEDVGLPRVSSFWWWLLLAISWAVGLSIYSRRYR